MRVPQASELLDIWELAQRLPSPARMLNLLAAAFPERSASELGALPLGRRNGVLLDLRERLFGTALAVVTRCPACGTDLELALSTADVRAEPPDTAPLRAEAGGYRARFRLPGSNDLLAIMTERPQAAAQRLLARCVLESQGPDGQAVPPDALPATLVAAIDAQMAAADPQAEIRLETACLSCAHVWHPLFDIADYLWQELHAWAKDVLRSVHALARAYGWREAEVLALSPTRRSIYLQLARA
ncbi:MAG TPA: hypothetical protein VGM17_08870 [Rhizomicrobium sp.]|jgi:hypothetical protein